MASGSSRVWPPDNWSWVKHMPGEGLLPAPLEASPEGKILPDFSSAVGKLCESSLDIPALAGRLGYSLEGKSVPGEARLVNLYAAPGKTELSGVVVYTGCVGLRRTPGRDPMRGEVERHWRNADLPEVFGRKPGFADTDDVTAYAKYHVLVRGGKPSSLVITPLQMTHFKGGSVEEVIAELSGMEGDSGFRHNVKRQTGLLEKHPQASVFEHDDRLIVLALAGLSVAESLGIKDVMVRTFAQKKTRFAQRTVEIFDFLRTGGRFSFSDNYI